MSSTFEFEGEKFTLVNDPADFTLDEMDAIEGMLGGDFEELKTHRMKMLRAIAWVSISRKRPGFTLEDAGRVPLRVPAEAAQAARRKTPQDHQQGVVVLSPTSAGPVATRKRASRSKPGAAAPTRRSSRTSSTSAPGNSDS